MSKGKMVKQIKIRRESLFESVINDILSIGSIGFLFWFNYNFIGNSYVVNFIIMFLVFFTMATIKTAVNKGDDKRFIDYEGVSDKKIQRIIDILEEEENE
jgi:hypothetical protein